MDGYTAKEVLLSTKDKLSELDSKLKRLKELSNISYDKNIKDIRYIIGYEIGDNPVLKCRVFWSDNTIKGKVNNLLVRLNQYPWGEEIGLLVKDHNGRSFIINTDYNIIIPNTNEKEFGSLSDEILADDFIKDFLKSNTYYPEFDGKNQNMILFINEIIIKGRTKRANYNTYFSYYPNDNKAIFSTINCHSPKNKNHFTKCNTLSDDILKELLNMKLCIEYFNDYRRNFIESSPKRNKDIIIPRFSSNYGVVDFNVEEDDKGLYLIKK